VFAPRIAGSDPKGNGLLETQVHLMPMKVIAADGDVAGTYDGSHHDRGLTITTRWDHGRWMVDGILTIGGQQL
jgi:hypothetical protein